MKDLKLIQRRVFLEDVLYVYLMAKETDQPTTYLFAPHSELHCLVMGLPEDGDYGFEDYPLPARVLLAKQQFKVVDALTAQYQIVGCYNPLNALDYTGRVRLTYYTSEDGGRVNVRLFVDDRQVAHCNHPGLLDTMARQGCYPDIDYGFVMLPGSLHATPNDLITSQQHFRQV